MVRRLFMEKHCIYKLRPSPYPGQRNLVMESDDNCERLRFEAYALRRIRLGICDVVEWPPRMVTCLNIKTTLRWTDSHAFQVPMVVLFNSLFVERMYKDRLPINAEVSCLVHASVWHSHSLRV